MRRDMRRESCCSFTEDNAGMPCWFVAAGREAGCSSGVRRSSAGTLPPVNEEPELASMSSCIHVPTSTCLLLVRY